MDAWIQEHYFPVVLVACTPAADSICISKNGLSVVDVLRPFSHVPQLNVPLRVGESSSRVQDIKLRFHAAGTLTQPKPEVADEHLRDMLQLAAQKYAKLEPQTDILQPMQAADMAADIQERAPWFVEYREEFLRMLSFGEHETLDHPVAVIYVVPADVQKPASHFEALQNQMAVPPLMVSEVMYPIKDKEFPKHYVLLHDGSTGMDSKLALDNLAAISRVFGDAHCSLLRINTASGDKQSMGATPEFFKRFQKAIVPGGGAGEPEARPPVPLQGLGAFLSVTDLDAIAALIREFTTRTLLPKLEERISRLNTSITAMRRGLRNRITRLWGKAGADDAANDKPYPWHTIESQMRQLADLGFILRQYEFATSIYRLAAQDYLMQSNSKWYAGVEEMVGLCCIMEPNDSHDPHKYFMRAYEHYSKVPGKLNRMFATRAMLLNAAYQQSVGRYLSTSHVLMRAHFEEENARAALLLEQAALALRYLQQPSIRKFAFYLVLAGLRYHSCAQKRLAIHAYRQVMVLYHGKNWRSIEEHLNDILGKQNREAGDSERALWHFMNLLDCSHRPAATQAHYVTQFLDAVKQARGVQAADGSHTLDNLPLPLIDKSDVRSIFHDQNCNSNSASYQVPDSVWTKLEACVSNEGGSTNWLDAPKQQHDHEEFNTCVAGEDILVDVKFQNPLHIKLRISGVRLVFEFEPAAGAAKPLQLPSFRLRPQAVPSSASSDTESERGDHDEVHPLSGAGPLRPRNEYLHVYDDKFTLHPGEVLQEQLRLTPLAAGWLRITGVQWVLNDSVEGRCLFDVKGRKRKKPKGTRPGQLKHFPPARRLLFNIIPAMPRLEVSYDHLPVSLYTGEVTRVTMTLHNIGGLPLRNLSLVLSSPDVCCPSSNAKLGCSLTDSLQDPSETVVLAKLPSTAQKRQAQLYKLWPTLELQPGVKLEWPLWLHCREAGTLHMNSVWYYEPAAAVPTMKYRTLRLSHSIQVVPHLGLRCSASPSPTDLYSHLLRLDLENSKEGDAVSIRQVTAATDSHDTGWKVAPMPMQAAASAAAAAAAVAVTAQHTMQPGLMLQPGEASTLLLQLLPPAAAAAAAAATAAASTSSATLSSTIATGRALEQSSSSHSLSAPSLDLFKTGVLGHFIQAQLRADKARSFATTGQAPRLPVPAALTSAASNVEPALVPQADPPVDVLLVWHMGPSKQQMLPGSQGQERLGLLMLQNPVGASSSGAAGTAAASRQQAVRMVLSGPASIRHDFRQSVMCVAPLRLLLRNCSAVAVKVQVEVGDSWQAPESGNAWMVSAHPAVGSQHSSPDRDPAGRVGAGPPALPGLTYQAGLAPSTDYVWCGRTSVNINSLEPAAAMEVPLQVSVFRPGTYAISGCRVTCIMEAAGIMETHTCEQLVVKVEAA